MTLAAAVLTSLEALPAQNLIFSQVTGYGGTAFWLGDVNFDGYDDFGTIDNYSLNTFSGTDGSALYSVTYPFSGGTAFGGPGKASRAGDVNADGIPDIAVMTPSSLLGLYDGLTIWSGADLSLIHHVALPPGWAASSDGVGDVNGDGRDDVVASVTGLGSTYGAVVIVSGLDGSILLQVGGVAPWSSSFGYKVAGLGDITGDTIPDFAVFGSPGAGGTAYAFSGANGSQVWSTTGPFNGLALTDLTGAGDVTGDGILDVFVRLAFTGALVLSGQTGSVRWSHYAAPSDQIIGPYPVGDLNSDGHEEISVTSVHALQGATLFSGIDGSQLGFIQGGASAVKGGEITGDGIPDVLFYTNCPCGPSGSSPITIALYTLATLVPATLTVVGGGCGPVLQMVPIPRLGTSGTIALWNGTPQAAGLLAGSAVGAPSLPVGANCPAWLDLGTIFTVTPFATDGFGTWFLPVTLTHHPSLAGISIRLQAVLAQPTVLTNALDLTLGY